MEDNNRRDEQTIDIDAVINENKQIKEAYKNLIERYNELSNTWMLNRVHILFDVIRCDFFDKSIRDKAIRELDNFLFPREIEKTEVEKRKE